MMSDQWVRPLDEDEAYDGLLECEKRRDYESAALLCVAASSMYPEGSGEGLYLIHEAQVYATLHQAQTTLFSSRRGSTMARSSNHHTGNSYTTEERN